MTDAAADAARHWPYVIGAYALVVLATMVVVLWTYRAMRRAEGQAEQLRREP